MTHNTKLLHTAIAIFYLAILIGCQHGKTVVSNKETETQWMVSDSIFLKKIWQDEFACIISPDSVKCYNLTLRDTVNHMSKFPIVKNYGRDSLYVLLNKSQIAILQYLLPTDTTNYSQSPIHVQSPCIPSLEFEFIKRGYNKTSIIISTTDFSWYISKDTTVLGQYYNYKGIRNIERFCNYFRNIPK